MDANSSTPQSDPLRLLDKTWQSRAELELGETDVSRREGLAALKTLMKSDPLLKCSLSDEVLIIFLRVAKFNAEHAFSRLKQLVQIVTSLRQWNNIEFKKIEHIYYNAHNVIPETLDRQGRKICTAVLSKWDPAKEPLEDLLVASAFLFIALAIDDNRIQVGGFTLVTDTKGLGLKHAMYLTPSIIKLVAQIVKNGCPIRVKEVHFVNTSKLQQTMYSMLSPLLGSKIRKRLFMHGSDMSTLHEHVDPAFLPVELGGTHPPVSEVSYCHDVVKRAEDRGFLKSCRDARYGV